MNIKIKACLNFLRSNIKPIAIILITALCSFFFAYFWLEAEKNGQPIFKICAVIIALLGGFAAFWALTDVHKRIGERNHLFTFLSGALVCLALLMVYALAGMYPFGRLSVLIGELNTQLAPFYLDLKQRLFGRGLLYSSALGSGAGYLPVFAYYLASPFTIITLIMPSAQIAEAVLIIQLLKAAAAAITFSLFIRAVFNKNNWLVTALSAMYSLCSFAIVYAANVMWTDAIILLPLICLGIHKLFKQGKWLLLVISLALGFFTQFQMGYILLIAAVLYAIKLLLEEEHSLGSFIKQMGKLVGYILLSAALPAFLLIPALLQSPQTVEAGALSINEGGSLLQLLSRGIYGVDMQESKLAITYCGVLILILIPIYYLSNNIKLRQKLMDSAFLLLCGAGLMINSLAWFWQGFRYPELPNQFAFVAVFAALIMGARVLFSLEGTKETAVWAGGGAALILVLLCDTFNIFSVEFEKIYISIFFIVIYTAVLLITLKRKSMGKLCAVLAAVVLLELSGNAYIIVKALNQSSLYTQRYVFYEGYETLNRVMERAKEINRAGYRIAVAESGQANSPSAYGYSGIAGDAYKLPSEMLEQMKSLGYDVTEHSVINGGFSPVADSLMGVKYIISTKELESPFLLLAEKKDDDYPIYYIYENQLALPPVYSAASSLTEWQGEYANPFKLLNDYIKAACNEDIGDVYENLPLLDQMHQNAIYSLEETGHAEFFTENYQQNGYISLAAEINEEADIFLYCSMSNVSAESHIILSDETRPLADSNGRTAYIRDLGRASAETQFTVNIEFSEESKGSIAAAKINKENLERAIDILKSRNSIISITRARDSKIKAEVKPLNDGVLAFSVPYDKCWSVKVDGKPAKLENINGLFCGVKLTAGNHRVEFKYWPEGLTWGIVISLLGLCVFVYLLVKKYIRTLRARRTV
ncbi:MAG: YfhO family protein [Oscillospiraceae bacterium]|jgi:uncharacterized membrane protein YfhO|nr:YfhO family protein [Oscillospiraceae bacterium]